MFQNNELDSDSGFESDSEYRPSTSVRPRSMALRVSSFLLPTAPTGQDQHYGAMLDRETLRVDVGPGTYGACPVRPQETKAAKTSLISLKRSVGPILAPVLDSVRVLITWVSLVSENWKVQLREVEYSEPSSVRTEN